MYEALGSINPQDKTEDREIELLTKNLSTKKIPSPDGFSAGL
jgi:hypothetical protein